MGRFKIIVYSVVLSFFMKGYSQSEISKNNLYFNENLENISVVEYLKKSTSFLYGTIKTENSSSTINRLIERYKFGKLDSLQNFQIRNYLAKKHNNNQLKSKTIIISHKDTIYGFDELPYHAKKYHIKTKSNYNSLRNKFDVNQKHNNKRLSKLSIVPLYCYSYNKGNNYASRHYKMNKISPALMPVFFKSGSGVVILKPDGKYFFYKYITEKYVQELLEKDDWNKFINAYKVAKVNLLTKPNGFFGKFNSRKVMTRFYIDKVPLGNSGYGKMIVPNGAVRVRSEADIKKYLKPNYHKHFFNYAGY